MSPEDARSMLREFQEAATRVKHARSDPEATAVKIDAMWNIMAMMLVAMSVDAGSFSGRR